MRAKSMVLIAIALGCGLVASYAISKVLDGKPTDTGLETVQIYVAKADIDVNTQLSASNVQMEDWPKSKVPAGAIKDLQEINDRFARVRFYAGEPILTLKLVNEIEGPAVKIPAGHRVCSLKVQMDTAVSGLVNPGDRVDIFGYFQAGREIPKTGTREILKNVRVFAVNAQTAHEINQEGLVIDAKTVSVLVKEDQVAKLMLASELGTLRLSLRRPNEDSGSTSNETATIESLFGSRSETADDAAKLAPDNQLAPPAGGFVSFMNNLKGQSQDSAAATMPLPVADPQPRGPVWQMTLLTPDGGTQFTWDDENGLPVTGDSPTPSPPEPPNSTTVVPPAPPAPVDVQRPVAGNDGPQTGSTAPGSMAPGSMAPDTQTEPD